MILLSPVFVLAQLPACTYFAQPHDSAGQSLQKVLANAGDSKVAVTASAVRAVIAEQFR